MKRLKTQYSILELFKNKYLLRHMSLAFILMVDIMGYFGSFNVSGLLSVNHWLSGFFHIIIDVPACIIMYLLSKKVGKSKPIIFMHFISAISIFACVLTVSLKDQTSTVLYTTLTLNILYKLCISSTYTIVHMIGGEIFPNNLRNQANGICLFIGRFGLIIASYGPITLQTFPKGFYAGLGVASVLAWLLCILLPETEHRSLPETVEDIEEWYKEGGRGTFNDKKSAENDGEGDGGGGIGVNGVGHGGYDGEDKDAVYDQKNIF